MGYRQRQWAQRAWKRLITELGGCCAYCKTKRKLTIDHKWGAGWRPDRTEWSHRISIYRAEARMGLLQVLCQSCNSRKGRKPPENEPF